MPPRFLLAPQDFQCWVTMKSKSTQLIIRLNTNSTRDLFRDGPSDFSVFFVILTLMMFGDIISQLK